MTRPARTGRQGHDHEHLTFESLAELMTAAGGSQEVRAALGHLVAVCRACRRRYDALRRLGRDCRHWSYALMLDEARQAPGLWRRLATQPYALQLAAVEADESFQTWGLCRLLQRRSGELASDDPESARRLANVAARIPRHLEPAYDPDWILDLQALSLCYLGNAWRAVGDLDSASDAFETARALRLAGTDDPGIAAEALALEALVRRDECEIPAAVALLDRVVEICGSGGGPNPADHDAEDPRRAVEAQVHKAWCVYHLDHVDAAQALLEPVAGQLDEKRQARLALAARCGLLWCAIMLGSPDGEARLGTAVKLADHAGDDGDRLRLRRAEARIDLARGERGPAEQALRETALELARRHLGIDAALAYFDLAALYLREGAAGALQEIGAKTIPLFSDRDVERKAFAGLLLFQQAIDHGRLTPELLAVIARAVEGSRRLSLAWWSGWGTVLSREDTGDADAGG
jgi:hypothetical protein